MAILAEVIYLPVHCWPSDISCRVYTDSFRGWVPSNLFITAFMRHIGMGTLLPKIMQSLMTVAMFQKIAKYLPRRRNPSRSFSGMHFLSDASWLSSAVSSPSNSASNKSDSPVVNIFLSCVLTGWFRSLFCSLLRLYNSNSLFSAVLSIFVGPRS